ncbi:hypothetical protein BDR05DRAFT_959798 [Suillus weaverae]|nr:hypothetical protein BDR05DRAFT_959798 [Suillus weaverae]
MLKLAHELNLDTFLPSAFYGLSRYGPSKVESPVLVAHRRSLRFRLLSWMFGGGW